MHRRSFVKSAAIVSGVFATSGARGLGATRQIPRPLGDWKRALQIVGPPPSIDVEKLKTQRLSFDRLPLYNDFTLTRDAKGRWHCIGIYFESTGDRQFRQDRLFHYISPTLQGPYKAAQPIDLGYGARAGVWSPYALHEAGQTLLFFTNRGAEGHRICIAHTKDPDLQNWERGLVGGGSEVLFSEPHARDPYVLRLKSGEYLLYYVCRLSEEKGAENVVKVRTSRDLVRWSDSKTILGTPPGYVAAESIFVIEKAGLFYMWVSGYDYSKMSLYISKDPMSFGDAERDRIEEQFGHTAEVVRDGNQYWMACAAIASQVGLSRETDLPISQHDLEGVWLQPISWQSL